MYYDDESVFDDADVDNMHITLRNDKQWRQFFQDNAKAAIAKLQKETEGNE